MGKYTKVLAGLPKFLGTEPAYQEKVDAVKKEILAKADATFLPASALGKEYVDLRAEIDHIKGLLSDANLELEAVTQLMVDQFEVEGVSSLKLSNGQNIVTFPEPYISVSDKEACRLWAIKEGLERSMALPWPTLSAIAKDALLTGKPAPDGTTMFAKTKIRLLGEGE